MSYTANLHPDILARAASIRFLLLDVDGVMTDGSIVYADDGHELKFFDAKDGAGIKFWFRAGLQAGIITGRTSSMVPRRAAELGIERVVMGAKNKLPEFLNMVKQYGCALSEVAVMGDDLMDLPLILRAGLGIAVADAVDEVRDAAHLVTEKPGGHGAVREAIQVILSAQGRWQDIVSRYNQP